MDAWARGLSRDKIVDRALALIDRDGLEALSMRRLADELGAGTMTLYGYFRDKRELVDALVDALAEREPVPELEGTWRERLAQLMRHLADRLAAHPALAQLRVSQPIATPSAFRLTEAGMAILRKAGFDDRQAAQHFRTLFLYTFSVAVFNPADQAPRSRRQIAAALAALPPDEYPTLASATAELVQSLDRDAQFEHGLNVILDGLEARAPEARPRPSGRSGEEGR